MKFKAKHGQLDESVAMNKQVLYIYLYIIAHENFFLLYNSVYSVAYQLYNI